MFVLVKHSKPGRARNIEEKSAKYYCEDNKPYPENESDEEYEIRQSMIEASDKDLQLAEIRAKQAGISEEEIQTSRDAGELIGQRAVSQDSNTNCSNYDFYGTKRDSFSRNRSSPESVSISSSPEIEPQRFSKLQQYIREEKWSEASQETKLIMLSISGKEAEGYLTDDDLILFPCEDMIVINAIWGAKAKDSNNDSRIDRIDSWLEDIVDRTYSLSSVCSPDSDRCGCDYRPPKMKCTLFNEPLSRERYEWLWPYMAC